MASLPDLNYETLVSIPPKLSELTIKEFQEYRLKISIVFVIVAVHFHHHFQVKVALASI